MYDELVKRLREWPRVCVQYDGSVDQLHDDAADAIEELTDRNVGKWIPVTEDTPGDFVSVQAHMTDAGNFPSVREAYVVNKNWFFPALKEFHPVDMWRRFDEPPKEE